jgi:AcrR family transcriptional regulator
MSDPMPDREPDAAAQSSARLDGLGVRERILDAAQMLAGDRRVSMVEIAAAAGIGRSTLYRHFASRHMLQQALHEHVQATATASSARSSQVATLPFRAPGQLGRDRPLALEVTHILDEVPPHLVADQLVAEARRAGGVAVALYVIDIDGSHLLRLAGTEEFPDLLPNPPALGPEIVPEGLPAYQDRLRERLPGCVCEPLWLRGRVLGLLLCMGTPLNPLEDIAKQGAAALELSNDYTDHI